jgi:hypothetical protein
MAAEGRGGRFLRRRFLVGLIWKTDQLPRQAWDKQTSQRAFIRCCAGATDVACLAGGVFWGDVARIAGVCGTEPPLLLKISSCENRSFFPRQPRDKQNAREAEKRNDWRPALLQSTCGVLGEFIKRQILDGLQPDRDTKGCAKRLCKTAMVLPRQARDKHT